MYSKGLLKALKQSGAEIWLLTDFDPPMRGTGLSKAPAAVRELYYQAKVLESLTAGYGSLFAPWAAMKMAQKNRIFKNLIKLWIFIHGIPSQVLIKRRYRLNNLRKINLHDLHDSPYERQERLSYLENLDGIICARHLYLNVFKSVITFLICGGLCRDVYRAVVLHHELYFGANSWFLPLDVTMPKYSDVLCPIEQGRGE